MLIVLTFAIAAVFTILAVVACLRSLRIGAASPAGASAASGTPACVAAHPHRPRGRKRGPRCGHARPGCAAD